MPGHALFPLVALVSLASSCAPHTHRLHSGGGPEDIVVIGQREGERSLVTATARRGVLFPGTKGRLEVHVPGKDRAFRVLPAVNAMPDPFYPAGMDWVESSTVPGWKGKTLIYVANSARKKGSVEVFEFLGDSVRHLASLGAGLKPNGLAAFADGRIFISTMGLTSCGGDHPAVVEEDGPRPGTRNTICMFQPATGKAGEGVWRTVITGIAGPNGLAAGPGDHSLMFCSYHAGAVHCVPLSRSDGAPLAWDAKPVFTAPFKTDNLKRSSDGGYTVCGQHNYPLTVIHFLTRIPCSTGGMVKLTPRRSLPWEEKDHSDRLSGHHCSPSTAVEIDGTIYAGQPMTCGVFTSRMPAVKESVRE